MSVMKTSITVKLIPSDKVKSKIKQLMKRDTKVIRRVLGILEYEGTRIFSLKGKKWNISRKTLSNLMLRTKGTSSVKYDLKKEFVNISHNEISECIDLATEMYKSYLSLKGKQDNNNRKKSSVSSPTLQSIISRRIGYRRFKVDLETHSISTIYSCKTNLDVARGIQPRVLHDKIEIPFVMSSRAKKYLSSWAHKSMHICKHNRNYYAIISLENSITVIKPPGNAKLGVIGIDLGIKKTATAVLYTENGIIDSIFLNDNETKRSYIKLEHDIARRQQEIRYRSSKRYQKFFQYMSEVVDYAQLSQYLLHLNRQIKKGTITVKQVKNALKMTGSPFTNSKYQHRLIDVLHQLNNTIKSNKMDKNRNLWKSLKKMRSRRAKLKDGMIKQLTHELVQFIKTQALSYNLYITIGKPNGIRIRHQRGSGNKWLRKKINSWAFLKFQDQLRHNLAKIGMADRLIEVNEAWTSKICYKCNKKGLRPKQETFYCSNYYCKIKINADLNGAANIAKRGIIYRKLISKQEYARYNIEVKQKSATKISPIIMAS